MKKALTFLIIFVVGSFYLRAQDKPNIVIVFMDILVGENLGSMEVVLPVERLPRE
jgi:hypothetical protein